MQTIDVMLDNEQNLKLLLEAAPMAIVTVNQTGNISSVNAKLEEMFGYHRDELIGRTVELLLPERFRQPHINYRNLYVANPRIRSMGSGLDLVARHKDGTEFPVEVGLSYIEVDGELLVIGSLLDITLRKQAEDELEKRVQERTKEIERRRKVADSLREILAILNSNHSLDDILTHIVTQAGQLLDANGSAIYRLEDNKELLTIHTSQSLPAEYVSHANIPLGQGTTGKAVFTRQPVGTSDIAALLNQSDGAEAQRRRQILLDSGYRAIFAVPLMVKEDIYGSLTLYYTNVREFSDEQVNLAVTFADQAALAIENARLRTQIERTAIAEERSRLARDLHDAVTQTLFSASLIAEVLPRLWSRNADEGVRRLEELRQLTRGALAEMRTLLLELRPSRLTEVPLPDLLRQLTEAVSGRARVPIKLEVSGEAALNPEVQVSLYRVAQEALNNVAKHAQANQATVKLTLQANRAELSIKDNGRGFSMKGVSPNSLGLSIMRERAELIGAKLQIKSEIDNGTHISVIWRRGKKDKVNET